MSLVILHIIPTMGQGGAERLLQSLAARPADGQRHIVLTLFDDALFRDGIDLRTLGFKRRRRLTSFLRFALAWRAIRAIIKSENVRIVHGWLYYGMLATLYARPHVDKVVWSIHNTFMPSKGMRGALRSAERLCGLLSRWLPDRIVYCAQSARAAHETRGYRRDIAIVIDNGVDANRFRTLPPEEVIATRRGLGFRETDQVVGVFARFHPQKDLPNTFAAVAECARTHSGIRLLLAGAGMSLENAELADALERAGVMERTVLVDMRDDIAELLAAIDMIVSGSAYAEAMPMVVLEALFCGLPIAATDVGDIARLDIPRSALVPPSNHMALARAIATGLDQGKASPIWRRAFDLTKARFSIEAYRRGHASLYEALG